MAGRAPHTDLTTEADATAATEGPAPLYVLRVVQGRSAGATVVLDWNKTPQVLVGQSKLCELVLDDPRVSRRHFALGPAGRALRLVDLRSTNGTRVGGTRVVEALLDGGESIEIGDTVLRVARAGEIAPATSTGAADAFGRVLGASQAMKRLFALCAALARSALPLVIEGETGTGKELLAEAIHEAGPRAAGPFVVFDCAAHDDADAVEALFGGALGGGAVEQAAGGTLVLDQVGELGPQAQARLGPAIERAGDVRFVATTRDDLDRLVQERTFREELLFRLAGARLQLPPLRERHGDVELLARHFYALFGGKGDLPKRFVLRLSRYDWPGNVRELQHAVSRALAVGDDEAARFGGAAAGSGGVDARSERNDFLGYALGLGLPLPRARQLVVREFERRFVEQAIQEHGGNVSRAAAASGLTRRYFHMLLAKNRDE